LSASEETRLIARTRQAIAAVVLLAWRVVCHPPSSLWRDWVFLLCLFWLFSIFGSRSKVWPLALGTLMVALFVLHSVHQLPLTFAIFRSLR
jgi:hypothetical protein